MAWFRNLIVYRLPTPWNITLEKFEEQLKRLPFERCSGSEQQRSGWISPNVRILVKLATNNASKLAGDNASTCPLQKELQAES